MLFRSGVGWDAENSALDAFQYDKQGELQFVPYSPEYPVFTTAPTFPEYRKGIPFSLTLAVPLDEMPVEGKNALARLAAIYRKISSLHPSQRLVIQTGLDQAQCRKNCEFQLHLPDGRSIPAGAKVFQKNIDTICEAQHMLCLAPSFAPQNGEPERYLTFNFDSHYAPRGHQWLAKELAPLLRDLIQREGLR